MATQKVGIDVNVSDNGSTSKMIKSVEQLNSKLNQVQRTASSLNTGGTAGSRAVAAKAAPAGSQTMSGQEYGQMRGSAGATGASARDFANQAQGLGGLVRLYATYAANLFAVSAAFTALSNAADTANLVKGMNQLGAASGVALGTLSKRLVEVTDGAISMREAMETVTKATSSGLSSKQVLELGKVAKTASQALGVDMQDAVNRLTRGITKLEPELLDELGIFTRIDPAVQKYAQSIGRAASSLTDFERRQAFAIAVLDEGNKKFGELELDANPYAKFLATLRDVGFTVLDVVNKAVIPLVDYLSKSPTALLTVLGGVAAIIVRQALPAFGQFRAGLESSAEEAQKRAISRAQDAAEAQKSISESVKKAADARVEAEVAKVVAAEKRITDIKSGSINKQSALYKILEKDLEDITDKDLKRIESSAKGLETRGLKDQAKAYRDTAQAVRAYQSEKLNYDEALKREQVQLQNTAKWYSIESITLTTAERAKQQATRASIISNAAYQASLVGVTRAMIGVNAAITEQGIKGFAAFTLRVKAGAAAIGGALATIGSAVNKFLGVLGILATAYSILDGFMDGASEQIGKFDGAVDRAKSSAENLVSTYKKIYENDPFSAQSVQARGNALMDVADGFKEIAEAAREAQKAIDGSWWAGLKEGLGLSGVTRNFGKSIATQITAILKSVDDPQAKKLLEDTAKSQLGITELSFDNIAAAAKRVGASAPEIKKLSDVITGVATQAKIAGAASAQFAESYRKVTEQIQKINQKFAVSDDIAVFAINSTNALIDLDNLLSQGVTKSAEGLVAALEGIAKGTNIFGGISGELIPLIARTSELKKEFSEGSKEVVQLESKLKDLKEQQINPEDFKSGVGELASFDKEAFDQAVARLETERKKSVIELAQAQERTERAKNELEAAGAKVQQAIPRALASSTELLGIRLAGQLAKVSNQVLQGAYASFDSVPELVAKSSALKLREIDAQIENTKALQALTTTTRLSAASQKLTAAKIAATQATGTPGEEAAQINLEDARKELELLELAVSAPLQALKLLAVEQTNNTRIGRELAGSVQDLAARTIEASVAQKQLNQQRLSEQLQGEIAVNSARIKQEQNIIKLKQDELKVDQDRLQALASQDNLGVDTKQQLADQMALNKEKQIELNYQQKLVEAARVYAEQALRASVLPSKDRQLALTNITNTLNNAFDIATQQKSQELEKSRLDTLKQQISLMLERIAIEEAAAVRAEEFSRVSVENAQQLKQIKLDTELGIQEALLNNSQLSASARAEIEYQSTLRLAALEKERAKVQANQEFERQATANTFAIRKVLAADTGEDGLTAETQRRLAEITEQEKIQRASRDAALEQSDALYNKTTLIAEATRNAAQQQERYNQLLSQSTSFAESLKSVFGELGETLGGVVSAFAEMATNADMRAKSEAQLSSILKKTQEQYGENSTEALAIQDQLSREQKKNARQQLVDDTKIIGSTKKLFKEKTTAYKVLSAVEKAMHLAKLAMEAKELAIKLGALATGTAAKAGAEAADTGLTVAGTVSRLPAYASEIYGKTIGQLGPIAGPAVATALVAAMFAMLGKGGGKGAGSVFVPNAEQRQETQGTGLTWDMQGNKVETGGGVFGDPAAKLDSINKGIQTIKDNSIEGLFYDNRMLKALERIAQSITGAAQSIYATPGIRSGLNFGSLPGTTLSSTWYQEIPIIGKALGSIFGGGTSATSTIQDTGIQLRGTLEDIASGMSYGVQQYKDILTQFRKDGGWFSSDKTWTELRRETQNVSTEIRDSFADVFKDAKVMFTAVAESAGISAGTVSSVFKSIQTNLDISLKGLTGEDVLKELNATISAELDKVARSLFVGFEAFRKFGEGYVDTVIRVVDSNNKVVVAFDAMGISTNAIAKNFAVSEKIVNDMAGSLEVFTEQAEFFIDNFLSEYERIAITRKGVEDSLASLGVATNISRSQFKELVQSLDLTTLSGRDTYQSLMDIAPQFIKVTERIEELKKTTVDLEIELLRAQGRTAEADSALRALATEGMTDAELAVYDYNESLKEQISSAQKLTDSAKSLKSNLENVTKTIRSQIQSLIEYRNNLALSDKTTLTATQQYALAKSEVDKLLATISGPATTAEEVDARAQAISKLSQATDRWLGLSRELYASGTQYTVDFNTVTGIITSVAGSLESQLTDTEKQLNALVEANSYLQNIETASKTTAELLSQYLAAGGTPVTGASFAVGTNYVPQDMVAEIHRGERIIPAADNAMLMQSLSNRNETNRVLVDEIKSLRREVQQLREQQAAETGTLVVATYSAQKQNADQITETITENTNKTMQSTRLQAKASIK